MSNSGRTVVDIGRRRTVAAGVKAGGGSAVGVGSRLRVPMAGSARRTGRRAVPISPSSSPPSLTSPTLSMTLTLMTRITTAYQI
jgi:hypothetical protein